MTAEGHNRFAPIFPKRLGTVEKATKCGSISLLSPLWLRSQNQYVSNKEMRIHFVVFYEFSPDPLTLPATQLNVETFSLPSTDLSVLETICFIQFYRNRSEFETNAFSISF